MSEVAGGLVSPRGSQRALPATEHVRPPGPPALPAHTFWRALWARTAAEGALLVLAYFVAWEVIEHSFLGGASAAQVHTLHLVRGVGAALMLGTWSFLRIRVAHREADTQIQRHMALLEERVRERTRELEEARAFSQHQEKMAALGVLAAGFAHDIGNPLASLSTELELLENEDDVVRFRESTAVLRKHVSRMSRTLREMVDFARRRRDEVTDVSLASAVSDSARLVCYDPRFKRIALEVDVAESLAPVRMVEDHLVLALVNLMLNSADAMPEGGTLKVTARRDGDRVELRLRDTGSGMTPEVLARAKEPLFTTKGPGRGTGLGLAVSDNIVNGVGGTLSITSAPGAGTEVVIRLPVGRDSDG